MKGVLHWLYTNWKIWIFFGYFILLFVFTEIFLCFDGRRERLEQKGLRNMPVSRTWLRREWLSSKKINQTYPADPDQLVQLSYETLNLQNLDEMKEQENKKSELIHSKPENKEESELVKK